MGCYAHVIRASGLVVKFNVAIVEPPVRFRACAVSFLFFLLPNGETACCTAPHRAPAVFHAPYAHRALPRLLWAGTPSPPHF